MNVKKKNKKNKKNIIKKKMNHKKKYNDEILGLETTNVNSIIKNKLLQYHFKSNNGNDDEIVEKITLPKGTKLYRSDTDICDFNNKKECVDTGKLGIYFSDNVMIPFGMSFEYKNKFDSKKREQAAGSFIVGEGKDTFFKEHQIGVFITTEDIEFYLGKYSYRKTGLGGEGIENYSQLPTRYINHVDLPKPIIYGDEDKNDSYYNAHDKDEMSFFELLFKTSDRNFLEFFIAEDKDLEKIQFVEAKIFNVNNFKKEAIESFKSFINRIFNYFSNEYISTLPEIQCEGKEDGAIKKKSRKKSNKKSRKKSRKKSSKRMKRLNKSKRR